MWLAITGVVSFILGVLVSYFSLKTKSSDTVIQEKNDDLTLERENAQLLVQVDTLKERFLEKQSELDRQLEKISDSNRQILNLRTELVKVETYNTALHEKLEHQNEEFKEARKKSLHEFENIANRLFEEKTTKFSKDSKENIDQLLKPLNENLQDFKKKVEETYDKESKERFTLEGKIKELVQLNQQISKDAVALTKALKGEAKTQGNWGEMILENILEHSGLVKNREYFTQETFRDHEGRIKQPDITIKYPDDRYIIIDSKVSLTAYERFANCEDVDEQQIHLADHMRSIKMHINELSSKEYDQIDKSLDFVMLFVPIEPAYMTAIHYDQELWNYAYKKRILLISPTNLIAALKMVADIWKREMQNINADKIAKRGELLYDKFVGFVTDLEDVGSQIDKLNNTYDRAFSKLSRGKGNLINQAEELRNLGLNPKKSLSN